MKTNKTIQPQAKIASALEQIAELARELCRPDYSDVDNAIGRYLLETVEPVIPGPQAEQAAEGNVTLRLRLFRLFGKRRIDAGKRPPAGGWNEIDRNEIKRKVTARGDCLIADDVADTRDLNYDATECENQVVVQ